MYINSVDHITLSALKIELQRIIDLRLNIDPIITDYMKSRIYSIENNKKPMELIGKKG